jgi:hypothetical protein
MVHFHLSSSWRHGAALVATAIFSLSSFAAAPTPGPGAAAFVQENDAAMDKMMAAMAIKPSGDIDRDFAAMMIPHHQGAIDMALAELRHGGNEQLRRIAQEIIVEQQQEIDAMHLAVGQPLSPSAPAPTQVQQVQQLSTRAVPAHVHTTP